MCTYKYIYIYIYMKDVPICMYIRMEHEQILRNRSSICTCQLSI